MNLMLINVSTRKFGRAVRLPGGDIPSGRGEGRSKSAISRRFVALSAARLAEGMASDLSGLDLLAIQIDRVHIKEERCQVHKARNIIERLPKHLYQPAQRLTHAHSRCAIDLMRCGSSIRQFQALAQGLHNGIICVPYDVTEDVTPQVIPDVLHRV